MVSTGLLMCGAFSPSICLAQSDVPEIGDLSPRDQEDLLTTLEKAQVAFEAERHDDALQALERAYALFPHPDITFKIAQSLEALKRYAQAHQRYTSYLGSQPKGSPAYDLTKEALTRIEAQAFTTLVVTSTPAGATVSIGGKRVGRTPFEQKVPPGSKDLRVFKSGYGEERRTLEPAPGETQSVAVTLRATSGLSLSQTQGDGPKEGESSTAGWVFLGTGVAALVGSGVAGGLYVAKDQEIEDALSARRKQSRPQEFDQDVEDRATYGTSALVLLGVGVVAGGIGAWMVWGGSDDEGAVSLALSPLWGECTGAQVGVTF